MSYDALRHFADSWGLVFMGLVYLALTGWALLPRNRLRSRDAAQIIFRDGDNG